MRRRARTWASVGVGVTATVAATAVLSGGLGDGPAGLLATPPAVAGELTRFADCEELRRWYVAAALPHVTEWGLGPGWGPVPLGDLRAAVAAQESGVPVAGTAEDAVSSGPTGTNVQEAGVDEPDSAKTDGQIVAQVRGRELVLTDVSGPRPRHLSTLRLPRDLRSAELLLVGERLVVLGTTAQPWGGPGVMTDLMPPFGGIPSTTRALVVDVGDPGAPRIEHDATFDGNLTSARQYGDVVRLVVSTAQPAIDFVQPRRGRTPREARRENRERVRTSDIEDWLPAVESDGARAPLVGCHDVQHPAKSAGYGTVTVVGFTPDDPTGRRTTAVTTSSDLVYSSSDRLYLATTAVGWWDGRGKQQPSTDVHAFALEGVATSYVATGQVPGQVRDRWSFSEYDGHLRVATAFGRDPWNPRENGVVVLAERGDRLVVVGRVDRMGIDEQIQSVRWFDEIAVVVTFRQVDPLYTVDLSDPRRPRVVGELKIPGFSSYLHPLGGDLLLGLGQDATRRGMVRGAQAAVFDLADLAEPRRVSTRGFGRDSEFLAASDPRGLTYLPGQRTVIAPLNQWSEGLTRLVVLRVDEAGVLRRVSSEVVAGWNGGAVRALPLGDGRVAVVTLHDVELLTP